MLRALERLLRPGGRTAFFTIHLAPGLSADERNRAELVGPSAVGAPADHRTMLAEAGFVDIDERDLTGDFVATTRAWLEELQAHADELAPQQPNGAFKERQAERREMLAATEDGLLRRSLFLASAPSRRRRTTG